MKFLLEKILYMLAVCVLRRSKPRIIAITGNVGKTSTKEAVYAVVRSRFTVRKSESNYNNEIGVPLTILNIPHYGKNILGWLFAFIKVIVLQICMRDSGYPEILILEMGADHPGDISYLTRLVRPTVGIVTAVGEVPVHVEFFSGPEELAKEKSNLVKAVLRHGVVILNDDDDAVSSMRDKTKGTVLTFGFNEHATLAISDLGIATVYDGTIKQEVPHGIKFTLRYKKEKRTVELAGAFGKPQAYAASAAVLCGISLGMTFMESCKALSRYVPPPGRLRLLTGIKKSFIIDDTYNASPQALHAALDLLRDIPAQRKVAVLGDMLELGKYSEEAHRDAGTRISRFADMLVTVGERARFIAEEAQSGGLDSARIIPPEKIFSFATAEDAGKALDPMIQEGDLVLVKGSQAMRMEKVVEEIMAEPLKAPELLVRQSIYWKKKI